jgi:hypothetical protein
MCLCVCVCVRAKLSASDWYDIVIFQLWWAWGVAIEGCDDEFCTTKYAQQSLEAGSLRAGADP